MELYTYVIFIDLIYTQKNLVNPKVIFGFICPNRTKIKERISYLYPLSVHN